MKGNRGLKIYLSLGTKGLKIRAEVIVGTGEICSGTQKNLMCLADLTDPEGPGEVFFALQFTIR